MTRMPFPCSVLVPLASYGPGHPGPCGCVRRAASPANQGQQRNSDGQDRSFQSDTRNLATVTRVDRSPLLEHHPRTTSPPHMPALARSVAGLVGGSPMTTSAQPKQS